MALEINEIAIQMRVGDFDVAQGENLPEDEDDDDGSMSASHEQIVEECVRRVLQTIKSMKER